MVIYYDYFLDIGIRWCNIDLGRHNYRVAMARDRVIRNPESVGQLN